MSENRLINGSLLFWVVFSAVSSAIFAKYSKGLCAYMYFSLSWLFVWLLFAQVWNYEKENRSDYLLTGGAALLGWAIGTFFIWKSRKYNQIFYL